MDMFQEKYDQLEGTEVTQAIIRIERAVTMNEAEELKEHEILDLNFDAQSDANNEAVKGKFNSERISL